MHDREQEANMNFPTRYQMAGANSTVPILVFDHGANGTTSSDMVVKPSTAATLTAASQEQADDAMSQTSSTMSDDNSSWSSSDDEYMEDMDDDDDVDDDDGRSLTAAPTSRGISSMPSSHSLDAFFLQAQRAGVLQQGLRTSRLDSNNVIRTKSSLSLTQMLAAAVQSQGLQAPRSMNGSSSTLFSAPGMIVQTSSAQDHDDAYTSLTRPEDHFQETVLKGMTTRVPFSALVDNYFTPMTPENVAAWESDMIRAIRQQDLAALRTMKEEGKSMQACNQFGETLLHVCVRRGSRDLLRFLLQDCGVSPRVCCENGRTPAHDALWCGNFDMLDLLLQQAPELLLIQDKRQHTPLGYVPKSQWLRACQFLDEHAERLHLPELVNHPIIAQRTQG